MVSGLTANPFPPVEVPPYRWIIVLANEDGARDQAISCPSGRLLVASAQVSTARWNPCPDTGTTER